MSATGPSLDQKLLEIVIEPKPKTTAEVVDRMNQLDAALPGTDGLRWFNWLYLLVTNAVTNNPPPAGWKNPQWVMRLDVVFANLYFTAIECTCSGRQRPPKSWQALFEARHNTKICRIQFALAGMNAHINHDLSLALLQTDSDFGLTPSTSSAEHADFEHVNNILAQVFPEALRTLAIGIVGELIQDSGKIPRLLAIWDLQVARDFAWDFAGHLRSLNGFRRDFALSAQDQTTGVIGRSLLAL